MPFGINPALLQYLQGQPQTQLQGEPNAMFGLRSLPFNALMAADQIPGRVQSSVDYFRNPVNQAMRYALATPPPIAQAQAAPAPAPAPNAAQAFAGGQPEQRRTSAAPAGAVFAFNRVPGDRETSGFRDPGKNQRVGGVSNSFHTRRDSQGNPMASDRVPPRGMSMNAFHSELKRLNPGLDVINEGDHVHLEPRGPTPQGASGRMRSAMELAGFTPPPAPNYGGLQRADQLYQQIGDLQMQPFSGTYTPQALPPLPEPELQKPVDWTAGDKLLAEARPNNPFGTTEEEQKKAMGRMSRAGMLTGLARAVGGFSGNEGLGATLARVGGMMLAGRLQGNEEIQKRLDDFEGAMQRYNIALAGREDGKAQNAANVANQNIQTLNQFARDKWVQQAKEIEKFNPRMENGVLITFDKNPQTGQVTETHTPMDPARKAASLYGRANVAMAAGNMANEFEQMTYKFNQGVASAILPFAMEELGGQGDPNGRNTALGVGMFDAANALVETGQWEGLMRKLPNGEAGVQAMREAAYKAAGITVNPKTGMPPTGTEINAEAWDRYNNFLVTSVVDTLVNSKKMHYLLGGEVENVDPKTGKLVNRRTVNPQSETVSAVEAFRARDRRMTIRTDTKGRRSYTESYDNQ